MKLLILFHANSIYLSELIVARSVRGSMHLQIPGIYKIRYVGQTTLSSAAVSLVGLQNQPKVTYAVNSTNPDHCHADFRAVPWRWILVAVWERVLIKHFVLLPVVRILRFLKLGKLLEPMCLFLTTQ